MNKVKLGEPVEVQVQSGKKTVKKQGRVTATSGTDNQCMVTLENDELTPWIPMESVQVIKPKLEVEPVAVKAE